MSTAITLHRIVCDARTAVGIKYRDEQLEQSTNTQSQSWRHGLGEKVEHDHKKKYSSEEGVIGTKDRRGRRLRARVIMDAGINELFEPRKARCWVVFFLRIFKLPAKTHSITFKLFCIQLSD